MQSQVTLYPFPQRLAPLASFGPSTRWMSPPRRKPWLRACTTPTAVLYIFQVFTSLLFFNLFHDYVFLENFGAKLFLQLFVSSGH